MHWQIHTKEHYVKVWCIEGKVYDKLKQTLFLFLFKRFICPAQNETFAERMSEVLVIVLLHDFAPLECRKRMQTVWEMEKGK